MAVLKADAYGHGSELVSPLLYSLGIRHFGAATVAEGVALRQLLPHAPEPFIYVMTASLACEAEAIVDNSLIPFVSDLPTAVALSEAALKLGRSVQIHVEVDTGIGRAGFPPSVIASCWDALMALPALTVTGICTHFTYADSVSPDDPLAQLAIFESVVHSLALPANVTVHAANSPAALYGLLNAQTLMRPGLLLYGISPSPHWPDREGFAYKAALSLYARVLLVREMPEGSEISYGRTYRLPSAARIATIGIGYGDGFPRRLSNIGHVLAPNGCRLPIRGRVCMDQVCVELPPGMKLVPGDVVTIVGSAGGSSITVGDLAKLIDATPHEITTGLTGRVGRTLTS
jgi:alanine racemase